MELLVILVLLPIALAKGEETGLKSPCASNLRPEGSLASFAGEERDKTVELNYLLCDCGREEEDEQLEVRLIGTTFKIADSYYWKVFGEYELSCSGTEIKCELAFIYSFPIRATPQVT